MVAVSIDNHEAVRYFSTQKTITKFDISKNYEKYDFYAMELKPYNALSNTYRKTLDSARKDFSKLLFEGLPNPIARSGEKEKVKEPPPLSESV